MIFARPNQATSVSLLVWCEQVMGERIETSTPLIFNKFIPPPPRRLWSADSPMEQLYRNKWMKYRKSISEKDPWNALDSPHFVDFKDLPDGHDNYFDNADDEEISTQLTFKSYQWLPGSTLENNNIIEEFNKCTLSAIKREDNGHEDNQLSQLVEKSKSIRECSPSSKKTAFPSIQENTGDTTNAVTANCEKIQLKHKVENKRPVESKIEKKGCTIVEPFSFETREKYRQEHHQARRERDSFGKEMPKGFRANPLPNFLKVREKVSTKAKSYAQPEHIDKCPDMHKTHIPTAIWKKKGFQPIHPKRSPIVPKAPNLLTASRAKERQRFEEQIKRKEQERQELKKKEEAERKKREEEEIAKLRRQLVHKAQPIRKYKLVVPKVTKRELSEPTAPTDCKRPRKF